MNEKVIPDAYCNECKYCTIDSYTIEDDTGETVDEYFTYWCEVFEKNVEEFDQHFDHDIK